ncbi:MAG TPA: M3 family oligoendopeptidase [Candidatus Binatia bacterium]|nr:M3 family oligoendopeptidase [Candidatus Binatia bacterium]
MKEEQVQEYKQTEWNLTPLLPQGVDKAMKEVEAKVAAFEKWKPQLKNNLAEATLIKITDELCDLLSLISRLGHVYSLPFSIDTADPELAAKEAHITTFCTNVENRLIFFQHWFKDLPEKDALRLIAGAGKHKRVFELIWLNRQYALKEESEQIINIKDANGKAALKKVYTVLTSPWKYAVDGKELSRDELMMRVMGSNAKLREEAYRKLLTKYKENKDALGEIYRAIVMDWHAEGIQLRKFKEPLNIRNVRNDLPDKAIEALLKVTEKNHALFHRWFAFKRKQLGLKTMRRFDLYAPLATKEDKISYDTAVKMTLAAFSRFSPDFAVHAQNVITENHVHSTILPNKESGAYCASPGVDILPYVMLNFTGTLDHTCTLAHELGHAVHSALAARNTIMTFHAPIPLAETASIFGETLLVESLMEAYPDRAKELLCKRLDDAYKSAVRQIGFVLFERKAHDLIQQGKSMKDVEDAYVALLRAQLGKEVEVDDLFRNEFYSIPHIYNTPFYCYGYGFGNLMAYAFYNKFRKEGQKAVPAILDFFAKGGSEKPIEMAKAVGVDITSEQFWQEGFDVLKESLEKLEKIK